MKIVEGGRYYRTTEYTQEADDPVTVLVSTSDGPILAQVRRWQIGVLHENHEGVTWCKGWGGEAQKALEALAALDEGTEP